MNAKSYYTRPCVLKRYLIGPIAPYLALFSDFLVKQGYSYATGQRYVREVGHLSRWLDRQRGNLTELSDEIIHGKDLDCIKERWNKKFHKVSLESIYDFNFQYFNLVNCKTD